MPKRYGAKSTRDRVAPPRQMSGAVNVGDVLGEFEGAGRDGLVVNDVPLRGEQVAPECWSSLIFAQRPTNAGGL
jgi:hypothetical protein